MLHDDFNPRSPHGERQEKGVQALPPRHFNPRSPHGERPCDAAVSLFDFSFQSTLPARGATAALRPHSLPPSISIHAPRTGSDSFSSVLLHPRLDFNPRSPHGERLSTISTGSNGSSFQSTLPARGATAPPGFQRPFEVISIHAPRTGSDQALLLRSCNHTISIHAPRTGSDYRAAQAVANDLHFNPRSPHGERPIAGRGTAGQSHFNPRSPHGERLAQLWTSVDGGQFQSTLPARGATAAGHHSQHDRWISIHAPRTGSDVPLSARTPGARGFQSTLPARGATLSCTALRHISFISIHAPRTGSDTAFLLVLHAHITQISIHAPRTGSDAVFVA